MQMRVTKIIILIISILFPLIVTTFIAFYSYGAVGGWEKNQDRFIEYYFNSKYSTEEQIERSVRFSAAKFQKNVNNVTFRDPDTKDALQLNNGTLNLANAFSVESYAIMNEIDESKTIQYTFFIYDIAYGTTEDPIVKPADLYIVSVQGVGTEADLHLRSALDSLSDSLKDSGSTGAATPSSARSGYYPIYDNNADDPENADKAHYVYTITPNNTYMFTHIDDNGVEKEISSMPFLSTREATFAIVQKTGLDEDPIKVWTIGTLTNIKSSTTANNSLNFNTLPNLSEGYKSDLKAAGYLKFVWPTLLWQSAIALVITAGLSYLFYNIWTIEDEETKKLKPTNVKKVKK
ncbi:MAG: hypothetical protein BWX94_00700 [Tenericutes bacterium ADurb.Bin140]|jgi:hypothetical protein|nr:MAG: hypothetical protein BWX94_00700 [Tenericutes bacterium ADurb.Bin140]